MPPKVAQTAPAFADAAAEASFGFGLNANAAWRAELEDRRMLLPPLPPVAQDFAEELFISKSVEVRAFLQQLDDEWTRRVLLPTAPNPLEDWTWSLPAQAGKDYSPLYVKPFDAEPIDFARPIVMPLAHDENDWPRRFEWLYAPQTVERDLPSLPPNAPAAFDDGEGSRDITEKRSWLESDVLLGIPLAPSTAWLDDSANAFAGSFGSLAAMLMLDEFVNAPAGGNTFGNTPGGRSARLGFSIASFR
jgi:hypothetical protein